MRKSVKASAVFSDLLPCDAPCPAESVWTLRPGTAFSGLLGRLPLFELCMMVVFMVMARV